MTTKLEKLNHSCLELFNAVLDDSNDIMDREVATEIQKSLLTDYRVIVLPEAHYALEQIRSFVTTKRLTAAQMNATFYRAWKDVISKTQLELCIDQLMNYAGVYGSLGSRLGKVYIPAEAVELDIPNTPNIELTVFGTISKQDAADKCTALLCGGTALSLSSIMHCCVVVDGLGITLPLGDIRNREAKALMIAQLLKADKLVKGCDPSDLFRGIIYCATEDTLLIKSKDVIRTLVASKINISKTFTEFGLEELASVFNRYKPLFLALKEGCEENKPVINRISKLSKRYHQPLASNPLNSVCSRSLEVPRDLHWLETATNSALLRALNACSLASAAQHGFRYSIRNGKSWVCGRERKQEDTKIASANFDILMNCLKDRVGEKFSDKVIYIPEGIEYGLPISEKRMLGNIPQGTKVSVPSSSSMAVGMYWKEGYNCTDLDLSARTLTGQYISWNTAYNCSGFVYSGDMTCLTEHGATEYIRVEPYSDNAGEESIQLDVNCYFGSPNYEFDIIIGTSDDIDQSYMMNPSNLISSFHFNPVSQASVIGFVERTSTRTTFVLSTGSAGNSNVATRCDPNLKIFTSNSIQHELQHSLSLNDVLGKLGAKIVTSKENDREVDIDLSLDNINRDFFNLFMAD